MSNPIATIRMATGNEIKIELYPEYAPNAVNSFIYLSKRGLFNNREIKRINPSFVIQPSYSDYEDPECKIILDGEFSVNGFENPLLFGKGIVGMGGDGTATSSGSCFFFTLTDEAAEKLNGKFTAFGKVCSGFEELTRIETVETKVELVAEKYEVYVPVVPEIMKEVTVETFGIDYLEPIRLNPPQE